MRAVLFWVVVKPEKTYKRMNQGRWPRLALVPTQTVSPGLA